MKRRERSRTVRFHYRLANETLRRRNIRSRERLRQSVASRRARDISKIPSRRFTPCRQTTGRFHGTNPGWSTTCRACGSVVGPATSCHECHGNRGGHRAAHAGAARGRTGPDPRRRSPSSMAKTSTHAMSATWPTCCVMCPASGRRAAAAPTNCSSRAAVRISTRPTTTRTASSCFRTDCPSRRADGNNHNRVLDPLSARYAIVAHGANALTYGASTLGGAIDFTSPDGASPSPLSLYASGGSYRPAQRRATAGGCGERSVRRLDHAGEQELRRLP